MRSSSRSALPVRIAGRRVPAPCGAGCTRVALRGIAGRRWRSRSVRVGAGIACRYRSGTEPGQEGVAGNCWRRSSARLWKLRSVAIDETLGSGTGAPEVTAYHVATPDRFAYRLSHDGRLVSDTTIVGTHEWTRDRRQ